MTLFGPVVEARRCTGCERVLPLTDFPVRKSRGTRHTQCRSCQRAYNRRWAGQNRLRVASNAHAHRARSRGAAGRFTADDIRRIWHRQKGRCIDCRAPLGTEPDQRRFDIDHVVSLAEGGTNEPENIALRCASCNRSKQ